VNIAMSAVYIAAVYLTVTGGLASGLPTPTILEIWALSQLGVFTLFVFVKARRVHMVGKLVYPSSIGYYVAGAALMAAILYVLQRFIVYGEGTFFLALELVVVGGLAVGAYGAFVLALDKTLRGFLRKALRESFA
jgi:hypothetical protein